MKIIKSLLLISFLLPFFTSCTPEVEPDKGFFLAKENGFAYLDIYQDKTCLAIECKYNDISMDKVNFFIKDGDNLLTCYDVILENNNATLYFDLESIKTIQDTTKKTFIPHLYHNDLPFDDDLGLITSHQGDNYFSPVISYINNFRLTKGDDNSLVISSYRDVTVNISTDSDAASVVKQDEDYIFLVKGNYQSDYLLIKESLKIIGDNNKDIFFCDELELNGYNFTAKFIVNDIWNNTTKSEGRMKFTYHPHLYVNDERYDSGTGNITNGNPFTRSEIITNAKAMIMASKYDTNMATITVSEIFDIKFKGFVEQQYYSYYPVSLTKNNDIVTLEISGWFPGTYGDYKVDKSCFKLFDGDISFLPYNAIFEDPGREFEGGTRFKLYYDVTSLKDEERKYSQDIGGYEFLFWCHMEFNGKVFDNVYGDIKPGIYDGEPDWTIKDKITYDDNSTFRIFATFGMIEINLRGN